VTPSNAPDAYRLLRQSIADPDPVIFLEPKSRYSVASATPATTLTLDEAPPAWRSLEARKGTDCTIIAYGAMIATALDAAESLAADPDPIDSGVLDLRCLAPIDTETLVATVRRTGRAVIVHEAPISLGLGAEIAALLAGHVFEALKAPVARVAPPDTPYPPASLEDTWLPNAGTIADAVRRTVAARPTAH
jgi:2-oxoisovalerate dehydrogenase E1 component beta subunit